MKLSREKVVLSIIVLFIGAVTINLEPGYAYSPPIGIPDPGATWGGRLHPIDTPVPSQPAGWPGQEVAHYYYIDNSDQNCTDLSNQFGYPDKPRCTMLNTATLPAGTYIEFHGNPTNTIRLTLQCTATDPCWIIGRQDDKPVFTGMKNEEYPGDGRIVLINSSYVFVDGLEFSHKHSGAISVINQDDGISNNISIRNCYAHDYTYSSNGSVFDAYSRDSGKIHDIVMYKTRCERIADPDEPVVDTDLHCATFQARVGSEAYNLYWLENNVYDYGGSGIQVNAGSGGQDRLHHVYLGKNTGYGGRQRLIGIKQSSHVIVSQNDYTVKGNLSAGGINETFGWALSPNYIWFIFNKSYDASDGWRTSDSSGGISTDTKVFIIGNKVFNIKPNQGMGPHDPANEWRYGQGVHLQNGRSDVYVVDNTFYNCYGGVLAHAADNPTHIYGNIFYNIYPGDTFIAYQNLAGVEMESRQSDYNIFFDPDGDQRWRWKSNDYTSLAEWRSAVGHDMHSQVADPKFTNGSLADFRLQPTSPAIDANNSPRDVYVLFQQLYGLNIRVDFNGVPRPQGAGWDMGAFEYYEEQQGGGGSSGGGTDGESSLQPPESFRLVPSGQ